LISETARPVPPPPPIPIAISFAFLLLGDAVGIAAGYFTF
jgi:hypothetical protein